MKILLADDNVFVRDAYKNRLLPKCQGKICLDIVGSGQCVIDLFQKGVDYAGIIIDVSMHDIDGFLLAEKLRKLGFTKPILLSVCWLSNMKKIEKMITKRILNGFIVKTGNLSNLISVMFKIVHSDETENFVYRDFLSRE